MSGNIDKLQEKGKSLVYDLTHLEVNTIIKDEMDASKAPGSPRLLLHGLAKNFHEKLLFLGTKYQKYFDLPKDGNNLFRGEQVNLGSGFESFKELSTRAASSFEMLKAKKDELIKSEGDIAVNSDLMMLQRIETISDDIRRILKMDGVDPCKDKPDFNFDEKETIIKFRTMRAKDAEQYELILDVRQFMVIKKANDIGTEKVVLQTIIGIDGDVTTRVTRAFAENPIAFIHTSHNEAIGVSVDFWKNLINVVVKMGESFLGLFTK
ncbi:MAG: hypothetical protein WCI92_09640 [Bacteroidota bacterium]